MTLYCFCSISFNFYITYMLCFCSVGKNLWFDYPYFLFVTGDLNFNRMICNTYSIAKKEKKPYPINANDSLLKTGNVVYNIWIGLQFSYEFNWVFCSNYELTKVARMMIHHLFNFFLHLFVFFSKSRQSQLLKLCICWLFFSFNLTYDFILPLNRSDIFITNLAKLKSIKYYYGFI